MRRMSARARFSTGVLLLLVSSLSWANTFDWNGYAKLLEAHVSQGEINGTPLAIVNYSAIKHDQAFDMLVKQLADADLAALRTKEAQLAFYINAYNIFAIKMVIDHWPLRSIRDVGSWFSPVWKKEVGILAGKPITLDEIEHAILRPLGEPRIHFAIVCASVSCPDLLTEPFKEEILDAQMERQTRVFLNNKVKGVRVSKGVIEASKIFDWFEEDFVSQGGVTKFIKKYRPDLPEGNTKPTIDYDWALNGR